MYRRPSSMTRRVKLEMILSKCLYVLWNEVMWLYVLTSFGYCAELTSVSDDSFRHTPGNTSGLGTLDDSAPAIEENISNVTDSLQLHVFQQGAEAGNDPLDLPCETPDEGGNEQRESPGRQLEDGVVHSVESIPAEPDAELSAGTGGPVGPSEGHDAPLSSGEEEADGVMQGGEISGKSPDPGFGF